MHIQVINFGVALGKFSHQWSDLCDIDIVPLMTDEEVGQVLAG